MSPFHVYLRASLIDYYVDDQGNKQDFKGSFYADAVGGVLKTRCTVEFDDVMTGNLLYRGVPMTV
jgi:hypothetical protein